MDKHSKRDGTQVSRAERKSHCRLVFPGTENWTTSFRDTPLKDWPFKETFKAWTKPEKERILSLISRWPDAFQNYRDITIYRSVKSQFDGNSGGSLPKANAIIVYDAFFEASDPLPILTHELAHIHILKLDLKKMEILLRQMGWEYDRRHKPKWSGRRTPLKQDSPKNPSEDLAKHIEDYLHSPDALRKARSDVLLAFKTYLEKS